MDFPSRRLVRAILPVLLDRIEQLLGRRFSFDATAVCAGFQDCCNLFVPRGRLLSSVDLGGHTVWSVPSSARHLRRILEHYRTCKRRRPDTAIGLLLPAHVAARASGLLSGMRQVLRFESGTALFNGLNLEGRPVALPGFPYAAEVWYDAPNAPVPVPSEPCLAVLLAQATSDAGLSLPLVNVRLGGMPLLALIDSGASHDFISAEVVDRLHLTVRPCEWKHVNLADGGKQAIMGQITVRLAVGSLRVTVEPYVLPALTDTAGCILGHSTLSKYAAVLDFASRCLRLRKGATVCRVPLLSGLGTNPSEGEAPCVNFAAAALCQHPETPTLMGRKAAKRMLRKGAHALLVRPKLCLNAVVPETPDPEVVAVVEEYADVFREIPGLPAVRPVDHTIPLMPGTHPVSRPMYRLSQPELDEVKRQVTDLLRMGMVNDG